MQRDAEEVKDHELFEGITARDLVKQMKAAWGFTAGELALGVEILEEMLRDPDCVRLLSFPACIVATGTRGVLKELLRRRLFDAVVTTCGTLDHDIARSWGPYYRGSFDMDDGALYDRGINRLGNVLIPQEGYGALIEGKMQKLLAELWDEGMRSISTRELCWEIGRRICPKGSLLHWAAENRIPIFIPGITDGAVGHQIWMFSQTHAMAIDLWRDERELGDLIFSKGRAGALIIGGGISKHHTIWWSQFRGGLDYAVYITSAVEWDGSLSGAKVKEAVSWGKVKKGAKRVTIEGEATVLLPLMIASLLTGLGGPEGHRDRL
jgi:deoxyhypusine synthase